MTKHAPQQSAPFQAGNLGCSKSAWDRWLAWGAVGQLSYKIKLVSYIYNNTATIGGTKYQPSEEDSLESRESNLWAPDGEDDKGFEFEGLDKVRPGGDATAQTSRKMGKRASRGCKGGLAKVAEMMMHTIRKMMEGERRKHRGTRDIMTMEQTKKREKKAKTTMRWRTQQKIPAEVGVQECQLLNTRNWNSK